MAIFHLIAPSGYCIQQDAAIRGVERLRAQGHSVRHSDVISRREQRFAGGDAERLADLNALARLESTPQIALAVRGGYGVTRLLPNIQFAAIAARLRQSPLIVCGHSDFTAFQLALLAKENAVTFSGPMLAGNFGAAAPSEFTERHFWQALHSPRFTLTWRSQHAPFIATGTVWGGNLAMLVSLLGTPWFPQITNGILVIEDINEHPFRIERMLLQLLDAGVLPRQRALVFGSFSAAKTNDYDAGFDLQSVRDTLRRRLDIPIIDGLCFGHEPDTVTLPLGACGELCHSGNEAALTLSGHPTLPIN
ncbi:muramoyltetrapeptide carboxypeptidase [Erwinia sp. HR93]|uniref:muramoyltetrapeptide carboxypeptidase n=1 Tax=Erwinia sp. HR93 TaxID=3094840 RepID=UPI002ADEDEE7|nr:muramoyltetrapeptide carboxypeptidase [Erwinia sp. HR93]MEA1065201.1 muramoyltetrapeptide carboxypeptidase [Erwinia sp. HR93]